ncbi:hypothetical protein INT47_008369 [Mucor saturninus]|uniref:PHD-type domain-containing protein n=1 Tax=Mucor saturninus TaxID=64648 RepID=A0A8H7V700_9FUNG|nr:hypothetical protein INT47_008369 [Mucor saturninus]
MTLHTSKFSVAGSTNNPVEKEEFQPTVLSQSSLSYYIQPFWDSLLQQQEQHSVFAKPIGGSSPDSYHENNHPAVIPIGGPRMAIDDLITGPTQDSFQQFMLLSHPFNSNIHGNSLVIKDDVFLAQPSILSRDVLYPSWTTLHDHDDTASLSSHSSLSSSQHSDKLTTSPCLSPVTSPTNFLYNHEPLFEGGIMEDLGNKKITSDEEFEEEEYDDLSSVLTDSTHTDDKQQQIIRRLSTVSDDLDWFKLLDAFRADGDLAETDDQLSDCTSNSNSATSFDHLSSEDDDYNEPINKKRKRIEDEESPVLFRMYELNISDHHQQGEHHHHHAPIKSSTATTTTTTTTKNVPSNLSQKRRKKSKATSFTPRYKKYQKKKTGDFTTVTILPVKKKEEPESKESISSTTRCQLIESVLEKDDKTVFQHLTEASIDWCRYCGTTEGVNWRPGPWGKRTLCNKHGCDYKGYGLASRLPRLDLSAFAAERLEERLRPVVQQFCIVCQSPEQTEKDNHLILCSGGCSRAYHQHCHTPVITVNPATDPVRWYCSSLCKENRKRNKVVVELPRKHMPLMHLLPKKKVLSPA